MRLQHNGFAIKEGPAPRHEEFNMTGAQEMRKRNVIGQTFTEAIRRRRKRRSGVSPLLRMSGRTKQDEQGEEKDFDERQFQFSRHFRMIRAKLTRRKPATARTNTQSGRSSSANRGPISQGLGN